MLVQHAKACHCVMPCCRRTFNLEELQLGNNRLSGPLPPQIGYLKKVDLVNVMKNDGFTCMPRQHSSSSASSTTSSSSTGATYLQCADNQLLPCFLEFSNHTLPRMDASNMSCPMVLRRSYADAQKACLGDGPMQLGKQAHNVADGLADEQVWKLEPSYYQYRGCECLPVSHFCCSSCVAAHVAAYHTTCLLLMTTVQQQSSESWDALRQVLQNTCHFEFR